MFFDRFQPVKRHISIYFTGLDVSAKSKCDNPDQVLVLSRVKTAGVIRRRPEQRGVLKLKSESYASPGSPGNDYSERFMAIRD